MAITFSSDAQNLSFKDLRDTAELAESYFGTQKDPEQMPTTEAESRWLFAHIPECVNVIKDDGKLIGFAFIIPCREAIMRDFLSKRIAEAQLYARVKKEGINATNFTVLYLCSAFVKPEYRKQGLASKAMFKIITILMKKRNLKTIPPLFFEGYSENGNKFAAAVKRKWPNLTIRERV